MMTTTPPTRPRSRRVPAVRGCGYDRRPARVSRWKRMPRTRGGRACMPAPTRLSVKLRARASSLSPWMRALDAAAAGLVMVAGLVSWGFALAILAF